MPVGHSRQAHAGTARGTANDCDERIAPAHRRALSAQHLRGQRQETRQGIHPLWTTEERRIFRSGADAQAKLTLSTEIFGDAAIRYATGVYPEAQKCIVFPGLLADDEAAFLPPTGSASTRPAP